MAVALGMTEKGVSLPMMILLCFFRSLKNVVTMFLLNFRGDEQNFALEEEGVRGMLTAMAIQKIKS